MCIFAHISFRRTVLYFVRAKRRNETCFSNGSNASNRHSFTPFTLVIHISGTNSYSHFIKIKMKYFKFPSTVSTVSIAPKTENELHGNKTSVSSPKNNNSIPEKFFMLSLEIQMIRFENHFLLLQNECHYTNEKPEERRQKQFL